jgi:hypothetical protein
VAEGKAKALRVLRVFVATLLKVTGIQSQTDAGRGSV